LNNEAFEREMRKTRQTIGSFSKDVSSSTKTLSSLSSVLRGGAFVYAANRFTDMAAAMLEAKRKGESMFDAFLSGLPVINRLAESANRLANELSGLAAAQETATLSQELSTGIEKMRQNMQRTMELNMASEMERPMIVARQAYEDQLKAIDKLESDYAQKIRDRNKPILDQIAALEKMRTSGTYFGGMGAMGVAGLSEAEKKRRIADLKSQLTLIENLDTQRHNAYQVYQSDLAKSSEQLQKHNEETKKTAENFDVLVKKLKEARDLERIVDGIGSAFTNAFDAAIAEGQKLRTVLQALAQDIMRVVVHETVSRPIGEFVAAGLNAIMTPNYQAAGVQTVKNFSGPLPGTEYHGGGIAGEGRILRNIPALAMLNAPRLHTGLRPNEFAAVLERGETVTPKGGGGGVKIYVSTPDAAATARWIYGNRKQIASALTGAQNENHTLRRSER
jgi:hypothetical protein